MNHKSSMTPIIIKSVHEKTVFIPKLSLELTKSWIVCVHGSNNDCWKHRTQQGWFSKTTCTPLLSSIHCQWYVIKIWLSPKMSLGNRSQNSVVPSRDRTENVWETWDLQPTPNQYKTTNQAHSAPCWYIIRTDSIVEIITFYIAPLISL